MTVMVSQVSRVTASPGGLAPGDGEPGHGESGQPGKPDSHLDSGEHVSAPTAGARSGWRSHRVLRLTLS